MRRAGLQQPPADQAEYPEQQRPAAGRQTCSIPHDELPRFGVIPGSCCRPSTSIACQWIASAARCPGSGGGRRTGLPEGAIGCLKVTHRPPLGPGPVDRESTTGHGSVAEGSCATRNLRRVRIVMVAETFLPQINGVANTARHVADRLRARGHELLIIAPGPGPDRYGDVQVIRARSFRTPGYKEFPVGLPDPSIERAMAEFRPDLVHVASPFIIGAYGLRAARRLGLPTVAIFQTDIAGFARQYPSYAAAERG